MQKSNLYVYRAQTACFYSINGQWLIDTSVLNYSKTNDNYSKKGGAAGAHPANPPVELMKSFSIGRHVLPIAGHFFDVHNQI